MTRAMELKSKMGDAFVSVEHLVMALAEDPRFGESLFKGEGLSKAKLEEAIKEVSRFWWCLCRVGRGGWEGARRERLCLQDWPGGRSMINRRPGFAACVVFVYPSPDPTSLSLPPTCPQVRGSNKVMDQDPEGKYEALSKYARDLTAAAREGKLDPVIGRDDEIRRCIQILSRRTKNNPVLIGEPGGWVYVGGSHRWQGGGCLEPGGWVMFKRGCGGRTGQVSQQFCFEIEGFGWGA